MRVCLKPIMISIYISSAVLALTGLEPTIDLATMFLGSLYHVSYQDRINKFSYTIITTVSVTLLLYREASFSRNEEREGRDDEVKVGSGQRGTRHR